MKFLKKHVRTVKIALLGIAFSIGISAILAIVFTFIDDHTQFDDLCYGSPYKRVFHVIPGILLAQIYNTFHKQDVHYRSSSAIQSGVFECLFIRFSMLWFFYKNLWHLHFLATQFMLLT